MARFTHPIRLSIFAGAGLLFCAVATLAADKDVANTARVILSTDSNTKANTDGTYPGEVPGFDVRPNAKQSFFVLVKNNFMVDKTFTVALEGLPGGEPKHEKVLVGDGKTVAIEFKPATPPKKDEPKKEAPKTTAKKEAEDEAKGEPPTGVELKIKDLDGDLAFEFRVVVYGEDGAKAGEKPVRVTIKRPTAYLDTPDVFLIGDPVDRLRRDIVAGITAKKVDDKVGVDLTPAVDVSLVFPHQIPLRATDLRAGSYRRTLSKSGQKVELRASNLPFTASTDKVRFFINVDGFPRAFTYSSDVRRVIQEKAEDNKESPDTAKAVRLIPVNTSTKAQALAAQIVSKPLEPYRLATLPTKDLRFRVETDNESAASRLVLRIARSGRAVPKDPAPDEVMELGTPKDQRVWVDVAGPDKGLLVTTSVADRVTGVDVSDLRGEHELQAVLVSPDPADKTKMKEDAAFKIKLVVDDTPPQEGAMQFGEFPKRLEKGKLLPVFVTAYDPETEIERVTVVVGKAGPDGKFPPTAMTADALQTPLGWVAQVPLPTPAPVPPAPPGAPPVKKDPMPPIDLTVVAQNEAGLTTSKVVRIELVDPKGATLEVKVERGGRPQPGAAVTLRDVDGKEKATGTTDPKGVVKFDGLTPGVYKLASTKEDTSYGLAASVSVTVPDPPPVKAIPVLIPLAKRR